MERIDFVKLRKRAGISQRKLAELLQVRPSFISAIENGKSRMPEEKIEKVKEIFELDSLEDYIKEETTEAVIPPHTHDTSQSEIISDFLNHFHDLAHQRERHNEETYIEALSRIEYLSKRNDRLSDKIDDLRDEVDKLRVENFYLKEMLLKNGIEY